MVTVFFVLETINIKNVSVNCSFITDDNCTAIIFHWGHSVITFSQDDQNLDSPSNLVRTCSIFVTPLLRPSTPPNHPLTKIVNRVIL